MLFQIVLQCDEGPIINETLEKLIWLLYTCLGLSLRQ
jgi:hypothetical protein